MLKIMKYEWKRYGMTTIILLAVAAIVTVVLALTMLGYSASSNFGDEDNAEFLFMSTIVMLMAILLILPYAGYVIPIISYITDISKKGLLFLTPSSPWLIIGTKVLMGLGLFVALYLETQGGIALLKLYAGNINIESITETMSAANSVMDFFYKDTEPAWLLFGISSALAAVRTSISIIFCIALARFAVQSVGGQVVLSIVFYYLLNIIVSMIIILIAYILKDTDLSADVLIGIMGISTSPLAIVINLLLIGTLYAVSVIVTDRKVNIN